MATKLPTKVPLTCRSRATSGATAGSEYSAMVANVCTANVAASGHIGIDRSSLAVEGVLKTALAGLKPHRPDRNRQAEKLHKQTIG